MKPPTLTSSSTAIRGIELIEYNLLGLPERITLSSGEKVVNAYDGRGVKHSTTLLDAAGRTVTKRQYIGDAVIDDGKLTMQLFEGGYLDAAGNAYYYITDWQGNITAVADASGNLVQSTGYYPDGEPWEEPQGDNRFLFAGKERLGIGGLNMYDFGPRMYNAAGCFWYQPDPAAASYPHISPYSYCAGNPVRFVDPSGMVIIAYGVATQEMISNTLPKDAHKYVSFDINGLLNAKQLSKYIDLGKSENYSSLLKMATNNEYTFEIFLNKSFEYLDANGCSEIEIMELEYWPPSDEEGIYLRTGEEGHVGHTGLPGLDTPYNSTNGNIQITINSALSIEGQAQAFCHEGYGHGYLYMVSGGSVEQSGHQPGPGMKELNSALKHRINKSIIETINNMR